MSIYGGFAKRQQESMYFRLVFKGLEYMSDHIIAVKSQSMILIDVWY